MVGSISSFSGGPGASQQTQFLQKAFAKLDQNSDGSVDKTELADLLTSSSSSSKSSGSADIDKLFDGIDGDKDGGVTQDELNAALGKMHPDMAPHMLSMQEQGGNSGKMAEKMLAKLDGNSDGSIDKSEFTDAASSDSSGSADAEETFDALDTNKDGVVSQEELSAGLEETQGTRPPMGPPPPPPSSGGSDAGSLSQTETQTLQELLSQAMGDDGGQDDGAAAARNDSQDDVQRLLAQLTRSASRQYDAASRYGETAQPGTSIAA